MTDAHLARLELALRQFERHATTVADWGRRLAEVLQSGGRLGGRSTSRLVERVRASESGAVR